MIVPVQADLEKDVAEEEGTLDVFLLTEGPVYRVRVVLAAGHVLDRQVNVDSQHEVSGEACEDEKTDLGAASTDGLPVIKRYKTAKRLFCNGWTSLLAVLQLGLDTA